jgi:hypothetical protein
MVWSAERQTAPLAAVRCLTSSQSLSAGSHASPVVCLHGTLSEALWLDAHLASDFTDLIEPAGVLVPE